MTQQHKFALVNSPTPLQLVLDIINKSQCCVVWRENERHFLYNGVNWKGFLLQQLLKMY